MADKEVVSTEAEKPKRGRDKRERRDDRQSEKSPYIERVVFINRVAKVVSFPFNRLLHTTDAYTAASINATSVPRCCWCAFPCFVKPSRWSSSL